MKSQGRRRAAAGRWTVLLLAASAAIALALILYGAMRTGRPVSAVLPAIRTGQENAPEIDFVRLTKDGIGLLSGHAPRNAQVTLFQNGAAIASTEADEAGNWMEVLKTPLESGTSRLHAEIALASGKRIASRHTILVSLPPRGVGAFLESGRTGVLALSFNADSAAPPAILQRPGMRGIETAPYPLAASTVEYSAGKPASISGTARNNETLRLYLDDDYAGEFQVPTSGRWRFSPGKTLDAGIHHLRIDRMFSGDTVDKRIGYGFTIPTAANDLTGSAIATEQDYWRIAVPAGPRGAQRRFVLFQETAGENMNPEKNLPGQYFEHKGR